MGRAPCCEKVGLKRGRWTTEEDDKLSNYILTHGEGSWRSLPKNAGLLRCGKSCRLRWINYLRSDLKRGNITPQEEDIIIKLHSTIGNRWSTIAGQLPGRTDNEIKNYWNSHLSRRIHTIRSPNGEESVIKLSNASAPPKRRGGRTSRAAMQRNKSNNSLINNIANNSNKVNPILSSLTNNNDNNNPSNTKLNLVGGNLIMFDKEELEMFGMEDIIKIDGLNNVMESDVNPIGPSEVNGFGVGPIREEQEQCCEKANVSSSTSSNGGGSTSSSSCFDWDMEMGMVDDIDLGLQLCNEKEQIMSWLWENDDIDHCLGKLVLDDVVVDVDYEQEQAMVAWLLS